MLIATLPAVYQEELMRKIIFHPLIDQVRYNAGACSPYSPKETLEKILALTNEFGKKLWVDLKGRQLRVVQWAAPVYGKIILNHELEVDCPAKVFFRGNEWSELKVVRGNTIYVAPPPLHAVGAGQAINIHGNNLKIKGYLTEDDKEYLRAACELGIKSFMLSFVEDFSDISDADEITEGAEVEFALKIESLKGLEFIDLANSEIFKKHHLMAARDDLMINIGDNKAKILPALLKIISVDPNAILASRIFYGLERDGFVSMGDLSDLILMQILGYKNFLLSDGICLKHFDKAMQAWEDFQSAIRGGWLK